MIVHEIHARAVEAARKFKLVEAELLGVIQEIEDARAFLALGYTSLFQYGIQALGLSESVVCNLIAVARKAREVPELKAAIEAGRIGIAKARKITPVLTPQNQERWLEMAVSLPQKTLEREVARLLPERAVEERVRYVAPERLELRVGITPELERRLERVKDLESQRTGRAINLEEALEATVSAYLDKHDPIAKAERAARRQQLAKELNAESGTEAADADAPVARQAVRAQVVHRLVLRDQGQCSHVDSRGERCLNRRWLDKHHLQPRSLGGADTAENLVTLCSAHHRMEHAPGI